MQAGIIGRSLIFTTIAISGLFSGCIQYSVAHSPLVPDLGPIIETRNKYRIAAWAFRFDDGGVIDVNWGANAKEQFYDVKEGSFEKLQPNVFSPSGMPLRVIQNAKRTKGERSGTWTIAVWLASVFTLPIYIEADEYYDFEVECKFDAAVSMTLQTHDRSTFAITGYSPIALLLPIDDYQPESDGRTFIRHERTFLADDSELVRDAAIAYGLSVRLKELEDSGKIPVGGSKNLQNSKGETSASYLETMPNNTATASEQTNPAAETKPLYNILSCKREAGNDFSYRFELELLEKNNSLYAFRAVQQEFRRAVKEDYAESVPGVEQKDLYVEFPEYELKGGKIEGRAVVLTISVTSLAYDPNTRMGKLAVKVNANQYEEARKWIRKNIETLARDKNIALTTGEIPPAAKFYLGREELKDGNVLEIEFKTE